MTTLWLARHANREDFADPDWTASADRPHDPGLSDDGVKQAKQLGRRATDLGVDRIFTSPFLRAVETAHPVAETTDEALCLEPGLGEWLNDDWFEAAPNTRSRSILAERFPRITPDHSPCRESSYPESKHHALARIGATAECLVEKHTGETLLLVGHGITVQGILHSLVASNLPDPGCPLASLTKVSGSNDNWSITLRNDTSHLENGARAAGQLV